MTILQEIGSLAAQIDADREIPAPRRTAALEALIAAATTLPDAERAAKFLTTARNILG